MTADVRWGLIGASRIAEHWVGPAIAKTAGCQLAALTTKTPERGRQLAAKLGIDQLHTSVESMVGDESIDAVYISSQNSLHAEQTICAAQAGKHVLCEKPLAVDVRAAQEMVDTCRRHGVTLATNHNKRQAPTLRRMRELVADGDIGQPLAVRVAFPTLLPDELRSWRLEGRAAGGGVVLDLSVHDLDALRFVLADEIIEVAAFGSNVGLDSGSAPGDIEASAENSDGPGGAADNSVAILRFSRGPLGLLFDSFLTPHADSSFEVHGSEGSALAIDCMGDTPAGRVYLCGSAGRCELGLGPRRDLFEATIEDFVSATRERREPASSGDDGLQALVAAEAMARSSDLKRIVATGEIWPPNA